MAWAYFGKGDVLHIAEDLNTATEFAKSGVVETDHPHENGYPTINGTQIVYEQGRAFDQGNIVHGHEISVPASIAELAERIRNV